MRRWFYSVGGKGLSRTALVVSLQSTDVRKFNDLAESRWLNGSMLWRVHIERKVCAPAVIIIEIACECSLQVPFIQYDDVVQTLPSNRADDPFRVRVLPGTPGGNQHLFYAHVLHPLLEVGAIHLVSIAKEILWCRIVWKGLHHLLRGPFGCWILGHIEMDDSAPMMGKNHQDEEHLESHCWYD